MAFCAITATSSNFALSSKLNEVSVSSTLCTSQSSTRSLSFLKSAAIPLFPSFSLKRINHQHPSLFLTVTASSSPSSSSSTTLAESQGLNVILSSSYILFIFFIIHLIFLLADILLFNNCFRLSRCQPSLLKVRKLEPVVYGRR